MTITALLLALAPGPAHQPHQDTTREVLEEAARYSAGERHHEALELVFDHLAAGAEDLALLRGEAARALADELEVAVLYLASLSSLVGDDELTHARAASIQVDPEHGMLFAHLAGMAGRYMQDLAPLLQWEFAGPFDNERGQGMLSATPAGEDPAGSVYPGKVREVGWRQLPATLPAEGVVRFSRLIDPDEQACVVARTWLHTPEDREVLLLLGGGEELRVWLEGEDLLAILGAHARGFDTWCVPLQLRAGWNELALQVGSVDGTPLFRARLAEPGSARPLQLESVATAPAGVAPRELLPGSPAPPAPRPGAATRYASGDDPETLFRRALITQAIQAAPRHERPGFEAIAAARQLRTGCLRDDMFALTCLRVVGARREEEDVSPWLAALDGALERYGPLPYLLRLRARHAWDVQPTYSRALEYLDLALQRAPHSVLARYEHAIVLDRAGQESLAQAELRALAADPALLAWPAVALLVARRLPVTHPARATLVARARQQGDGEGIMTSRSIAERASGSYGPADVLGAMDEKLGHHPWSVTARRQAAESLLTLGLPEEALRVLDEALGFAPERAALHRSRARALLAMGETESAVLALETVVALDFSDEDERRLLEHLQAIGGAPFHEGFTEPLEDVLARRAGDFSIDPEVAPREVLLSRLVVEVQPDGTAKRYRRQVERVLSEAGARELDRRSFRVWPGEEEVRILAAEVHRQTGEVEAARTGRSGRRGAVLVDLPPLVSGDVVDMEWRQDDLRTTHFGNYFGLDAPFAPDGRLPARESEIVLIVPPSLPLTLHPRLPDGATYSQEQREDGATVHRWVATDLAPRRLERLQPPALEGAPRVQASSYASWEDFGRWWWNLIEDEIRVSSEMQAKVTELTEGLETPLERLRAVYDFVVTDIRYNAWEFGVHGYQPYSAPVIFSRRFGDCKDKAILLRALLSETGIEAWPVLIRMSPRRYEEDHALALVQHFNHCIAFVPAQEGIPEMYLDGTARLHPLEVLPDADRGAKVLIVRDDGAETARIPFPTAEKNLLADEIVVDLTGEQTRVRLTRRPTGRFDPEHRHRFTGNPEERAEEVERFLTGTFGALRGTPVLEGGGFEDLTRPLELVFESGVEAVARKARSAFELPSSFDPFDLLRSFGSETQRETDLLLGVPWSRSVRVDYRLPAGARPVDLPPPVEVETEDASYLRRVEVTGSGLRIDEQLVMKSHRIPVERYGAFRDLCRSVDAAQVIALKVEEAK